MRAAGRTLWIALGALALSVAAPATGRADHHDESAPATDAGQAAEPAKRHALTLYAGIFGNKEYVQVWEGVALSIGVHERVALLGRVTGLHIIDSDKFREGHSGIGEGGLGFTIADNTTISVLGGTYFGEIEDPIISGAFNTAQPIGERWLYVSVGGLYGFDSERWQNTIFISTTLNDPSSEVLYFAGIESILYNEGDFWDGDDFVDNPDDGDVKVQIGPVLGIYKRSWDAGLRLGVGGGDYGVYGTGSVYKNFSF
jgi:hypothetical protein